MISHHHQTDQAEVLQQSTVDEFLVDHSEKTLSSEIPHTAYEYSTSIPDTEPSTSPWLKGIEPTYSCLKAALSTSSSTSNKLPVSEFMEERIEKLNLKVPVQNLAPDPYIKELEKYITYFKDSMCVIHHYWKYIGK